MDNETMWCIDADRDDDYSKEQWADRAPQGWVRCAGCGDEWHGEDEHICKCVEDESDQ